LRPRREAGFFVSAPGEERRDVESDFWLERWDRNEIGFHQPDPNRLLTAHWSALSLPPGARVLVPLCGKSLDMLWLRARGHDVIGVELSPLAAAAFDAENHLGMTVERNGAFACHRADGLTLMVGDFFELTAAMTGRLDAVYDRAALVALPEPLRRRYAHHLTGLLPPGAQTLVVTFEYDQQQMAGPPFSVDDAEVRALFGADHDIERLSRTDILAEEPRFRERGLTWLFESACRLARR
jgi:thiopurine S-methyltransferase